jgi:hypothetical protein
VVLDSPGLREQGLISSSLPQQVLDLLESISNSNFLGLQEDLDSEGKTQQEIAAGILKEHGFKPQRFIDEALRQLSIGGSKPEQIVSEVESTSAKFALRNEMKQLREKEALEQDASELERIAQEKLLKKRSIKGLGL